MYVNTAKDDNEVHLYSVEIKIEKRLRPKKRSSCGGHLIDEDLTGEKKGFLFCVNVVSIWVNGLLND